MLLLQLALMAGAAALAWFVAQRRLARQVSDLCDIVDGAVEEEVDPDAGRPRPSRTLAPLAQAIDELLGASTIEGETPCDESTIPTSRLVQAQEEAVRTARKRAQAVIDENTSAIATELNDIASQVEAVRTSADTIDDRVAAADHNTSVLVGQASDAVDVVAALEASLGKVGGMAKLIANVAQQTNLLALNATIEAARAGDAGKGFSVVAAEVKQLATTTTRSTKEIARTIEVLERDAAAMGVAISGMTDRIGGVNEATAELAEVARHQHRAVGQLDHSVGQALGGVKAMANLTEGAAKRKHLRAAIRGTAAVRVDGHRTEAELLDLGEGGMLCTVERGVAADKGTLLEIDLPLQSGIETIRARVAKRDTAGNRWSLGLQFLDLTPDVSERLHRHLTAVLRAEQAAPRPTRPSELASA
jgi:hypothetical protein